MEGNIVKPEDVLELGAKYVRLVIQIEKNPLKQKKLK